MHGKYIAKSFNLLPFDVVRYEGSEEKQNIHTTTATTTTIAITISRLECVVEIDIRAIRRWRRRQRQTLGLNFTNITIFIWLNFYSRSHVCQRNRHPVFNAPPTPKLNYSARQNKSVVALSEFSYFILLSKFPNQSNRVESVSFRQSVSQFNVYLLVSDQKFVGFFSTFFPVSIQYMVQFVVCFDVSMSNIAKLYSKSRDEIASGYWLTLSIRLSLFQSHSGRVIFLSVCCRVNVASVSANFL